MYEIIEEGAKIAKGVKIGNYCVIKSGAKIGKNSIIDDFSYIDSSVEIGEGNYIGKSVHLHGRVKIGKNNYIEDSCVIGLPSKHIGYHFYQGRVIIGDNNFIGNNCAIDCGNNHLSDKRPELKPYLAVDLPKGIDYADATIIGNRCYILNNVAIHHNCRVGLGNLADCEKEYDTIICAGCCLNGFVQVRKGSELSSGTYVREFASLGEGSYTAMLTHVVKDVLPFSGIRGNQNIGDNKLINKFSCTKKQILKLRKDFLDKKRSGNLKLYEFIQE